MEVHERTTLIKPKAATANSDSHAFSKMAVSSKSTLKADRISTKRQNENLTRRIETLFVKSREIWELYGVDVAVIVMKNGRYSTYRSMDKLGWPPSMADIVGHTISSG